MPPGASDHTSFSDQSAGLPSTGTLGDVPGGFLEIFRRGDFVPSRPTIARSMHLDSEVAVIEGGE
jgi:hypothetical protein